MLKPFLAALFAVPAISAAQNSKISDLIFAIDQFRPDGRLEIRESKGLTSSEFHKTESGIVNGVHYDFYYTDGSGTFAGMIGNVGKYDEPVRSNWDVGCKKDPVNDTKYCHMHIKDLWIYVYPKKRTVLSIGYEHYPWSTVTIRIDGEAPISTNANSDGNYPIQISARIVQRLKSATSVTTRYMKWPYKHWVDTTWDLYGFNETFEYINWAVERIK